MPSVFKIYLHGISDSNMIWRSDETPDEMNGDLILSPKLKKEINKADGFDFMILPSSFHYDSFEKKKTILFLTRDNKCIFRGRVSEVKTDIFKQRTITCEGDLAFLADTIQSPNKRTNTADAGSTEKKKRETLYYGFDGSSSTSDSKLEMTAENYFRGLIVEHNVQANGYGKGFEIGTLNVPSRFDSEKFERTSYQNTSSIISSDLLSVYGGVLRTRYENNTAYIDWLEDYTTTSEQSIRFGLNMIEMDQEPPSNDVWSVLLPVGEDNVTIADVNGGSIYLENQDAITKYGYIVHCHQFNNVKKASDLKRKAEQYLMINGLIFPDNLIVKAIDLQLIGESNDPLELGEKIKVVSEPHNVDITMSCIAMELDIFNPENNSYTIGTIMPPDKEKRQDSLSSKQSESSSRHSKGIGDNANKIGKLNEDINVNANNINVNAKNIAVNALNIAVNAENIAIVAKNIAIAADTIDIKTRQLSIEFGEKTDDMYGYIHASAEGIKTFFANNITGLSSYISQTAGEISAGVQNAAGTLSSKITLTEQSLTTEFNKKLYGPSQDGTGGLVADYSSKIQTSATTLTSNFNMTLYGEGGSYDNPTGGLVKDYRSTIEQTSQTLTSNFNATIYGEGGTPENPTAGGIIHDYESKITQSATEIQTSVSNKLYGQNGTAENPTGGIVQEYRSSITQVSGEIRTEVKKTLFGANGTQSNPETGSVMSEIKQNADQIDLRVKKGDIASTINQTAQSVRISASKIDLDGYVTVSDLNTTNAKITNLVTGVDAASSILATTLKVTTGNLNIGDRNNTTAKLVYHDTEFYPVSFSMSNITPSSGSSFLGWGYQNGSYQTSISLNHSHSVAINNLSSITIGGTVATNASDRTISIAHSHSVSTGSDGTITLGGMVSTDATNRSFRIADTKTYIDGVSAARLEGIESVTVRAVGYDTVSYPSSYVSYNSSTNKYEVKVRGVASNNKFLQNNLSIDATEARNSVDVVSWSIGDIYATADNNDGVLDCAHIKIGASLSNGTTRYHEFNDVSMYKVYNAGETAGKNSVGVSSVWLSEIYPTEDSGDDRYDCAHIKINVELDNGKTDNVAYDYIPMWKVYYSGARDAITKDSGVESITIGSDGVGHATITAYLPDGNGNYRTYKHYVSTTNITDYHN